jgi:PhzF family phenazine biosynthesis protein
VSQLTFKQVDVFTDKPLYGNPVAVIIGGDTLDTETMQRIARWTNLSEATFLLPSSVADYKLRIFSPSQELPFAGHPTIGSAHAAIESQFIKVKDGRVTQECSAGIIELDVSGNEIFLKAPQPRVSDVRGKLPFAKKLLRIDVGPVWITGEVASPQALAALKPDLAALAQFSIDFEATGVTVFAESKEPDSQIHVRSFAPGHGIPEDPVCGSGNICVAAYLRATNQLERFGNRYVARQGMQMGRDGRVSVHVGIDGIRIGGRAVTCVEGTLKAT